MIEQKPTNKESNDHNNNTSSNGNKDDAMISDDLCTDCIRKPMRDYELSLFADI